MRTAQLVTIGMPVYNGGPLLRRALDSLVAQDYPALEFVVRDNASTDETEAVVREYAARDARMRYVRNPSNLGPTRNFRLVLEEAKGTYFMWAAHDDFWSTDYVSRLVAALEANPKAILAAGGAVFLDPGTGAPFAGAPRIPAPLPAEKSWKTQLNWDAAHWIYGVFVRERLVEEARKFWAYPPFGGDTALLVGLALSDLVVGDNAAVKFTTGRLVAGSLQPVKLREFIPWYLWFGRTLAREVLGSNLERTQKVRALVFVGWYWVRKLILQVRPRVHRALTFAMNRFPRAYRLYRRSRYGHDAAPQP